MKNKGVVGNIGGSIIMQAVNILSNLILPPLLISAYGSQLNGLVSTITQIISYVSLVGAGLSVATTQALYKPLADNDKETVSGMMRATGLMFNRVGCIFVAVASAVALVYPFVISSDLQYWYIVLLMIIMSISGAMEFFVTGRYRSLLYADRKIYAYSIIQSVCLVVSTVLAVLSIKLGFSILWTQFVVSTVYVLRALGLSIYVHRKYNYVRDDSKPIKECIAKRKDAMYHQLTGLVITGSQSILLSIFVGLEAASIYAIYNVVFSGLQSVCTQVSNAVVPYLGRLYAVDNKEVLAEKYNIFELVFNIFIAVVFASAFVLIDPFIAIYTKGADIQYADKLLALLFIARGFANTYRLPAQGLINAAGYFAETKRAATIEAGICLSVELVMVQFIGIYGIMIGNLAALAWRGFEMIVYTNRHIVCQTSRRSILRVIKDGVCIVLVYLMLHPVVSTAEISGYAIWIGYACAVTAVSVIVISAVYLLSERKQLATAIRLIK